MKLGFMRKPHFGQAGVTMVELMIAISIATVMSVAMLMIALTFFGDTIRSQVTAQMAVESHFMLRAIVEDLRLSSSVAATNSLADVNAPGSGWTTSDTANALILKRPATTSTNDIIYDTSTGNPYDNEHIYFVNGTTLYKRLLKNTNATGNSVSTTCPQASSSSSCSPDKKYSTNVTGMSFIFYDDNNAITTDPLLARSVTVGLTSSRRVFGKTLTFNNSILTKLRN